MRKAMCAPLLTLAAQYPLVFLTGDLGFMALEPLQKGLGKRFINAGVAEQNMISVAAGLTLSGCQAWVYSIAPFCYARPFEQIRNDICLNKRPVKLIGNGGGYAYGSMGGTHHALEDYGALLTLIGMKIFVPAFALDVAPIVLHMAQLTVPSYLRLGHCELPRDAKIPDYAPWRLLLAGQQGLLVCMGPLVGSYLQYFSSLPESMRPEIWVVTELPLISNNIPMHFLETLKHVKKWCIAEEHVAQGGFGQNLIYCLIKAGHTIPSFTHACAQGYVSGYYGSQKFHREECGLSPAQIAKVLECG